MLIEVLKTFEIYLH
jgi:hypothetical protein